MSVLGGTVEDESRKASEGRGPGGGGTDEYLMTSTDHGRQGGSPDTGVREDDSDARRVHRRVEGRNDFVVEWSLRTGPVGDSVDIDGEGK